MAEELLLLLHNHAATEELLLRPYLPWTPTRQQPQSWSEAARNPSPSIHGHTWRPRSNLQEMQASPFPPQERRRRGRCCWNATDGRCLGRPAAGPGHLLLPLGPPVYSMSLSWGW